MRPFNLIILFCLCLFGGCQRGDHKDGSEDGEGLSPEEALEHFRVEEGFEVRLVAAEPLVIAPVAMTFDEKGRIWVVEMQNYMPDTLGIGENVPSGTVAILEDTDGDGVMDKRKVFLDSLVLPRALCLVEDGVLVAEPPNLWYVRRRGDTAGEKVLVDDRYAVGGNVEHQPNGLLRGLDNWIYNAKSARRYRKKGDEWLIDSTRFRGQWGISQDDWGRLFYNHNSTNLLGDYFPPRFGAEHPFQQDMAGYSENIVPDNRVYPIRPTSGVNRGYMEGILDERKRLVNFTAACGPLIYRGGLFGADYRGNAFVAEPSANLIKRNIVDFGPDRVAGKQAYENKEFLASTDERFRPVNLYDGPDGVLYVVDMYRGIIQHKTYLTDYLKSEIRKRELTRPLNRGRIYKVVPKGKKAAPVSFPGAPGKLAELLGHPNGWVRDKAQQMLVDRRQQDIVPRLKEILARSDNPLEVTHAIWTLEGLDALEWRDLAPFFSSTDNSGDMVRIQAFTAIPSVVRAADAQAVLNTIRPLAGQKSYTPYVAYLLNDLRPYLNRQVQELLFSLALEYPDDPFIADAIISNLGGEETLFLDKLNRWNADSALVIKEKLGHVLENIEESQLAKLNGKLEKKLAHGKVLYKNICQSCHGPDGNGIRTLAPPLNRSQWVTGDADRFIAIVLYGLTGPVEVNEKLYKTPEVSDEMPGIASNDALSDYDIAQIVSFVRNAWSNRADTVSAGDITRVRARFANRETPFTADELR